MLQALLNRRVERRHERRLSGGVAEDHVDEVKRFVGNVSLVLRKGFAFRQFCIVRRHDAPKDEQIENGLPSREGVPWIPVGPVD